MENFKKLEKELDKDNKYKRKVCVKCDYKLICAGECEKTINVKEVKKCQN